MSTILQGAQGCSFLIAISNSELICNSVAALITPELYDLGLSAIQKVKEGVEMANNYKNVELWPSVYTAMQVIVNRVTPPHRDEGGCLTHYDLLVSAGTHTGATVDIPELGMTLAYSPGTIVSLCGRIFFHQVLRWEGERICVAHFIKDNVHERLQLPRPTWPKQSDYFV